MKRIEFAKSFEKSYAKRIAKSPKLQKAYDQSYKLFAAGKRRYPIDNHALTGTMAGKRAFSVANDARVIYRETDDAIIFIDIGSHNQVYR